MNPTSRRPLRNASTNGAYLSNEVGSRNPITGIADCCVRAANGHVAAIVAASTLNSRRFMDCPLESPHQSLAATRRAVLHTTKVCADVAVGSEADISLSANNVRFTSDSGHQNLASVIFHGPGRREAAARHGWRFRQRRR